MPQVVTPALVLHVIPYGDTSKILRLLTREAGLLSVIARGARRARARTGPRLDLFAAGTATVLVRSTRDLHPLIAFELAAAHGGLGLDVHRFAAASALIEIALRCAPADPHPDVFDAAAAGLNAIEEAPEGLAETAALLALWGLVVALGFAPSVNRCVICGRPTHGTVHFAAAQGGAVCATHRAGQVVSTLQRPHRAALEALTSGRLPNPPLDARHAAAHRRLLLAFIRHHIAEQQALPALHFWDTEAWNPTSS